MFLSEPLLAATAVIEGTVLESRAADAFCDSNMFVLRRGVGEPEFHYTEAAAAVARVVQGARQ
jgi:hypothetical protein